MNSSMGSDPMEANFTVGDNKLKTLRNLRVLRKKNSSMGSDPMEA